MMVWNNGNGLHANVSKLGGKQENLFKIGWLDQRDNVHN